MNPHGRAPSPAERGASVLCPHCGRHLNIPPGQGERAVGCRACRHCYRYNYATGAMTPLGRFEPPGRHGHWPRVIGAVALGLIAIGLGFLLYLYLTPGDAADAEAGSALEEARRQLKSLTD